MGILGWGFWGWQGVLGCVVVYTCAKYRYGGRKRVMMSIFKISEAHTTLGSLQ